jgi:hypothetical protein
MHHKWKQLVLIVNFLFGLRVNEITNKTFMLDPHWPSICHHTASDRTVRYSISNTNSIRIDGTPQPSEKPTNGDKSSTNGTVQLTNTAADGNYCKITKIN